MNEFYRQSYLGTAGLYDIVGLSHGESYVIEVYKVEDGKEIKTPFTLSGKVPKGYSNSVLELLAIKDCLDSAKNFAKTYKQE